MLMNNYKIRSNLSIFEEANANVWALFCCSVDVSYDFYICSSIWCKLNFDLRTERHKDMQFSMFSHRRFCSQMDWSDSIVRGWHFNYLKPFHICHIEASPNGLNIGAICQKNNNNNRDPIVYLLNSCPSGNAEIRSKPFFSHSFHFSVEIIIIKSFRKKKSQFKWRLDRNQSLITHLWLDFHLYQWFSHLHFK